jgi:hypothetical protein
MCEIIPKPGRIRIYTSGEYILQGVRKIKIGVGIRLDLPLLRDQRRMY